MKKLLQFALLLVTIPLIAQTPVSAYINSGSGWNPWSAAAGFGALGYQPTQVDLYCQASLTAPWTPCNPSGGGGSGTVTSFVAPSGSWPAWLVPTVTNSTTTPSLAVAAGTIPTNPNTCTVNTTLDKCLGVSPYLAVAGDWSTAINQAMTDLASTGGTIHGCGVYPINGPLLDPSFSNALVKVPTIASVAGATNITITLQCDTQSTTPNISALSGMTLQTSVNTAGGNFIGGQNSFGFTAVRLILKHVNVISTALVPNLNLLNASLINALSLDDVILSGTGCTSAPALNTGGIGLQTPNLGNNFEVTIDKTVISCMPKAAILQEHTQIGTLWMGPNHDCVTIQGGGTGSNPITASHIWGQGCIAYLVAGGTTAQINISLFDMESDLGTGPDIYDPSNLLTGYVFYKKSNVSGVASPATVTGGANLSRYNLASSDESLNSSSQTVLALSSTHASGGGFTVGGTAAGTDTWGFYPLSSAVSNGHVLGLIDSTAGNWVHLYSLSSASGPGFDESPSFFVNCWSSSIDVISHACDTGLSRDAAGVVDVGNGTQGDKSGTLNLAAINLGGVAVKAAVSNVITSATGGSGTGTVTCATATCTNLRGSYTVAGGTFATGTLLTLVWPTTTTAYVCSGDVLNNATGASIGYHSVATATGMTFSSLTAATGLNIDIDYGCQP